MAPQLLVGDRVVVSRMAYDSHAPRRGDIIVFDCPPGAGCQNRAADALPMRAAKTVAEALLLRQPEVEEFIKRVIGLPGETIEGDDGSVFVNGRRLIEPYLPAGTVTSDFGPIVVEQGMLTDWYAPDVDSRKETESAVPVVQALVLAGVAPFSFTVPLTFAIFTFTTWPLTAPVTVTG
jgi:signal peptidase I